MQKAAFLMRLKPGQSVEYERRHNEIWPELVAALTDAGISDYSIFLEPTSGLLFGVQRLAEHHAAATLPTLPVMRRWWAYMADLMETNPDYSPVVQALQPVFHLP